MALFFQCSLALFVRLLCVGGLAVDKRHFLILILVSTFLVQGIQFTSILDQRASYWRMHYEVKQADAVAPVALAAASPIVLSAIVLGAGAFYCYSHGGKEAWIQFTGALRDGVSVTKSWIIDQIAAIHNIVTSPLSQTEFVTNNLNYDSDITIGQSFPISSPCGGSIYLQNITEYNQGLVYSQIADPNPQLIGNTQCLQAGKFYYSQVTKYKHVPANQQGTAWIRYMKVFSFDYTPSPYPSFDPSLYPDIFSGPALLSNCHAVALANKDNLSLLYAPPVSSAPSGTSPSNTITVPIVAQTADGSLVDDKGRKLPPPPPGVVPGIINPPVLGPDTPTIPIETPASDLPNYVDRDLANAVANDLRDFFAPVDLVNDLINIGITGPITGIKDIGGVKTVTWTNAQGQTVATAVPATLAQTLAPLLAPAAVGSGAGTITSTGETDPGNPADIELPNIPTFDPEMDWGQEEPWPWDEWISMLPFIDVLEDSSINLSGASSVISFNYSMLGANKTISYNFSQWEGLINSMGFIIYACSCWYALQLALLKRD